MEGEILRHNDRVCIGPAFFIFKNNKKKEEQSRGDEEDDPVTFDFAHEEVAEQEENAIQVERAKSRHMIEEMEKKALEDKMATLKLLEEKERELEEFKKL